MTRPLVKVTSSRTCVAKFHPERCSAGVMNWVQMSRSERLFLSGTREYSTEEDHCYEDILRLMEVGAAGFEG